MNINPFPPSSVLSFHNLIEYAPGGVVSKQIMKVPTGNITLFSFDSDQGLSEHSAPFDALVQIIEGDARISIGGEPFVLESGQSIIMPANIPHALSALTPFKMILTMIRS